MVSEDRAGYFQVKDFSEGVWFPMCHNLLISSVSESQLMG